MMHRVVVLAAPALLVLGITGVPLRAQNLPSDSSAVVTTIARFHDALRRGDSVAALALLSADALILEAGGIESRAEYRAGHLPADTRYAQAVPATRAAVSVRVRGDIAWVVAESRAAGTFNNRPVSTVGAELAVLVRTSAGWRIQAIHWSSRRGSQ